MPLPPAPDVAARIARDLGLDGDTLDHVRGRLEAGHGVLYVIDQVQTSASKSDERWAEPLPPCPGHPHPLSAREHDGELWWICPLSAARVARIGELPR